MPRALIVTALLVLSQGAARATTINRFVAVYQAVYNAAAAPNSASLQFIVNGSTVRGGLRPGDVGIEIVRGSRLVSSLQPGTSLQKTRLSNGDLLVTVVGDIRTANPGQIARIRVVIEKGGVSTLRLGSPRWGDVDLSVNTQFTPLGPAALTGGAYVLDPQYLAHNDSAEAALGIRNLEFLSGIKTSTFSDLDVGALFRAGDNPTLPSFVLSPGTSSLDLGLTLDAGPEPPPTTWLAAMGQILDPGSGEVIGAFIHGVQAVPEPSASVLALGGCAAVLALARLRKRG